MIKQFILLLNFIGLFLIHWYTGNVTLDEKLPSSAKAGDEFTVEVTIDKGATGGFARFQDELPEGFTAVPVESKGGDPRFDVQKFKIIWTSLPSDQELHVTYKVTVANTVATGDYTINSKFSFIADNNKQEVTGSHSIHIDGAGAVASGTGTGTGDTGTGGTTTTGTGTGTGDTGTGGTTTTGTGTGDTGTGGTTTAGTGTGTGDTGTGGTTTTGTGTGTGDAGTGTGTTSSEITIKRIVPNDMVDREFNVEIHLKKGSVSGFAKLEDELPAGCSAEPITTANADFKFEKQKVKFIWVSIPPSDAEIVVSYKVTLDPALVHDNIIFNNGKFAYIMNDAPKTDDIPMNSVTVKPTSQISSSGGGTTSTGGGTTSTGGGTTSTGGGTTSTGGGTTSTGGGTTSTGGGTTSTGGGTTIPTPQNGVVFKVQVMALHRNIGDDYFKTLGVNEPIEHEMHEGYVKYILKKSASPNYKDARDYREGVRPKIKDAWVTAYNNGKRVLCQDALMVSNQKWVP